MGISFCSKKLMFLLLFYRCLMVNVYKQNICKTSYIYNINFNRLLLNNWLSFTCFNDYHSLLFGYNCSGKILAITSTSRVWFENLCIILFKNSCYIWVNRKKILRKILEFKSEILFLSFIGNSSNLNHLAHVNFWRCIFWYCTGYLVGKLIW